MGTQGPGRKRIPNREKLTAEDDALSQIAREAEARLAAKRAARAEAREIRMKELERQQKEMSDDEERMSVGSRGSFRVEERPDRDFLDKGSRTASTLSAATLASLGGASSRRGSCDTSFSVETEASIRDMKDALAEAEEKYRKAMVSNAQLHNEKSTLMYQVETLKEELSELEEVLWESRRHCDDRTKELERERQAHGVLQFQFKEMKETLRQTEELLTTHGVVVAPDVSTNGDTGRDEEDDVSGEERSHGGRESTLGRVGEQLPAGGSRQDGNLCRIYKRSQSLNVLSTSDRTKSDSARPLQRSDHQARERQGPKPPGRNETARKQHRDPNKTSKLRQDAKSLFRNEGTKRQQMTNELRPAEADDRVSPGRIRPHIGSDMKSSAESVQDLMDVQPPCDEGTRLQSRKVQRSRLVPPRPAKDIILDHKASTWRTKQNSEKPKLHVVMGDKTPSSDADVFQKCFSAAETELRTCRKPPELNSEEQFTPEKPENWRTGEDEPLREAPLQITDLTEGRCDLAEGSRDWTSLENTLQVMLSRFVAHQGVFPGTPGSLSRWFEDFKETLKNFIAQCEATGQQDSPGGGPSPEGLEGLEQTALMKDSLVSAGFLEVLLVDSRKDCELLQDPPADDYQEPAENSAEVSGSTSEEKPAEEEKQSRSDLMETSCSEDFVFVESYFAEPAKARLTWSGSDRSSGDSSKTERVPRSQSGLLFIMESVETQLKRHRTSSSGCPGQSSKVKRLIETTAGEIRAMAVPELVLMRLQDGRIEDPPIDESTGPSPEDLQELCVGDMDSCEEVDEEATQQQQRQPATGAPVASGMKRHRGRTGIRQTSRKGKTDCRIS